jgi:small subunit ribosomal protein S18
MTKRIKLKISTRLLKKKFKKMGSGGSKRCRFCSNAELIEKMDYKNAGFLRSFLTERGKILASRISGNCALHQRSLTGQIKKSRTMALLPYVSPWL